MRTFIATALALAFSGLALAAGGQGPKLEKAHVDITDKASLQRGAGCSSTTVWGATPCNSCATTAWVRIWV